MTPCSFGFHTWGLWSAPYAGHGGDAYQHRRCLDCNRAQAAKIITRGGFGASRVPQAGPEESIFPSRIPAGREVEP